MWWVDDPPYLLTTRVPRQAALPGQGTSALYSPNVLNHIKEPTRGFRMYIDVLYQFFELDRHAHATFTN